MKTTVPESFLPKTSYEVAVRVKKNRVSLATSDIEEKYQVYNQY